MKDKSFAVVNIIMAYLGREIWLFLTEEGRPGALYSVSGRSPASRQREAVYYPEERRAAIEPLDKSQTADTLRHYNAMRFEDDLLVVSDGLHTEDIFTSRDKRPVALRRILSRLDPEPDSLHTPRIAGMICYPLYYLAIITEKDGLRYTRSIRVRPKEGIAHGISTYSGYGTEPEPFVSMPRKTKFDGKLPENIAEFFASKIIDPEFFVCCTTALWNEEDYNWKIAILNKSS